MLQRLRYKASVPALLTGGARSISRFVPGFSLAGGGSTLRTSYIISSSNTITTTGPLGKLHTSLGPLKQLLSSPTEDDVSESENDKSSPASTTEDDDDFAELGPAASENTCWGTNLESNKPKGGCQRPLGTSHGEYLPQKLPNARFPSKMDKFFPNTPSKLETQNGALSSKIEDAEDKCFADDKQHFVEIDNIPPNISLEELREAVSLYGKVTSCSMKAGKHGHACCHIKFKRLKSKRRVLEDKQITVKNFSLPVSDLEHSQSYITIRISNISMETTEGAICSMCKSYGSVSGLARTKEGAVDVVFRVEDDSASQSLVRQLNNVSIDNCRWLAQLLPELGHVAVACDSSSQHPVESQISDHLESLAKRVNMQRIYLEDLSSLHQAVLHLRDEPP